MRQPERWGEALPSRDEGRDVRNAARPRDQVGATTFQRDLALVGKQNSAPLFQGLAEPRPTVSSVAAGQEFASRRGAAFTLSQFKTFG